MTTKSRKSLNSVLNPTTSLQRTFALLVGISPTPDPLAKRKETLPSVASVVAKITALLTALSRKIFLDITKAYDRVHTGILFQKLSKTRQSRPGFYAGSTGGFQTGQLPSDFKDV